MFRSLKKRVALARRFAGRNCSTNTRVGTADSGLAVSTVVGLLGTVAVVEHDDSIIVTEVGFVTMALKVDSASRHDDFLVIPGVDDHAQTGYLVLCNGYLPYHSLARCARQAVVETQLAHHRATELVNYFGSRQALKRAATSAPWYLLSRVEDVRDAGLCEWGSNSFLRRYGLFYIAHKVGLPRFALGIAGTYGRRITAATVKRHHIAMSNTQELLHNESE